jgi:hypothetical protein
MRSCTGRIPWVVLGIVLLFIIGSAPVIAETPAPSGGPAVYLNFNEGSGIYALDASGHGDGGTLHDADRIGNGACSGALLLNGNDSYVDVPYTAANHPTDAITVSAWFYTDSYAPQVLLSSYHDGGYRLGFSDGNDLWWTVSLGGAGDVSVPIRHDGITLWQWHQVTGTYDGSTVRVYLDGILRNQVNASGAIHYQYMNDIMVGADAGTAGLPDTACPRFFRGGVDEIRIYDRALSYSEVMEDRYQCTPATSVQTVNLPVINITDSCSVPFSSFFLGNGDTATRLLTFFNRTEEGIWQIGVPPGSQLVVSATDLYSATYPDEWYVELRDGNTRLARAVAFPNINNTPVTGVIQSGNATVLVDYFGGPAQFPATVRTQFESVKGESPAILPGSMLENPIIVIYSASWATLIAIIIVILWLHKRKKQ